MEKWGETKAALLFNPLLILDQVHSSVNIPLVLCLIQNISFEGNTLEPLCCPEAMEPTSECSLGIPHSPLNKVYVHPSEPARDGLSQHHFSTQFSVVETLSMHYLPSANCAVSSSHAAPGKLLKISKSTVDLVSSIASPSLISLLRPG